MTHRYSDIAYAADYYPFGMPLPGREVIQENYRFKNSGEFAEHDEETGLTAFELRLLSRELARWLAPDPARQYASPYVAFGNNPVNRIDRDGGVDDWYTDADGNLHYDPNVKSQADVDLRGGGEYIDEAFSDGVNEYLPGGWVLNLETREYKQLNFIPSFTEPLYPRSSIDGYDYKKAIETLNENAESSPVGYCAKYVRLALEGGGLNTSGHPRSAKDYNVFLPKLGFKEVPVKADYQPLTGDIVVMQSIGNHIHGHIQMYNGENWVSDYKQPRFYPYIESTPTFQIFR